MVHSNFLILNSGMMEDNTPVYAMSRYGRPVIILGRYRYNKRSASTGKRARWACVRTGHGCKAILITWENRIIDYVHEHNHWKRISAKLNSTHGNMKWSLTQFQNWGSMKINRFQDKEIIPFFSFELEIE